MMFRDNQTERDILKPLCIGRGLDIGCGSRKISESVMGVDIIAKGEKGKYGNQKGMVSNADINTSGDKLKMFKDNSIDFIVAKHNLEHYDNPLNTLIEWGRVLKLEGKLGVIVPDNRFVDSMNLDPTHKVSFTPESLRVLFLDAGFKILSDGIALKHWSIFLIGEKQ